MHHRATGRRQRTGGTTPLQGFPLSWARRHCATAVAEGMSLDGLYASALVTPRFDDARDRISAPQLTLLYYHANLSTEDEARRIGRGRLPVGLGALATRALFGCVTLESGLGALSRLYELSAASIRVRLTTEGDEAVLAVNCDDARPGGDPVSLEDAYLSYFFMCVSYFLGRPLRPMWIETADPGHMNLDAAHWATRAPVRLGRVSAIHFPKALLAARRAPDRSDELFSGLFEDWLAFVEPPQAPPAGGQASLEALSVGRLAASAGVSPATLRRRLDRQAGGFRRLREEALVEAGVSLLLRTPDSVEAVAAQLGYSDARSFRRFIKAATGRTPFEWRQAELAPARPDPAVRERIRAFARSMNG